MNRYPLYIFDLDGTLYRGDEAIPFAADTVNKLKDEGAAIRYLTNNSGQTREYFQTKLLRLGFKAELREIYSSATGAVKFLLERGYRSIFAVGEPGLVTTLQAAGFNVANRQGNDLVSSTGDDSQAVLVGICRHFDYKLMNAAMQRIRAGQEFVATNTDATYPMEGDLLVPGAGSIVAAIQTCSGKTPFVVGKPNPYLVSLILEEAGSEPTDALVVGDRVDTDIESGRLAGCPTFLVLTGVTSEPPAGQIASENLRALL